MANQNLFTHVAIFVCFIYVVFIVGVQLSWHSSDSQLLTLKSFHEADVQLETDQTTPVYLNATKNVGQSFGFSPSPTTVSYLSVNGSFHDPPKLKKKPKQSDSSISRKMESKILNQINNSKASVPQAKAKNDLHPSSTKVPVYNCSKNLLIWCDITALIRDGTYLCNKCQCHMQITRSVNIEDLKMADIVVFYHMIEKPWDKLIRARPKGQIWVFFSRESPVHCKYCMLPRSYGAVFNMTLTYLSDSDIVVPYGVFTPFKSTTKKKKKKQLKDSPSLINWAENKTKSVLWVASNCIMSSWDRLGFVKHLSTYLPVDMFGKCGNLSCRKEEKDHCEKVFSQYKFYLALENTPCREYITEKVWHNSFERGLIPVVFGADKSDYVKILPENSFIFAEDFNSTQQLARFLERVDRNDTLFNEYFKWRQLGYIKRWTRSLTFKPESLCRVVQKLIHLEEKGEKEIRLLRKQKTSIEDWWRSSCRELGPLKFSRN